MYCKGSAGLENSSPVFFVGGKSGKSGSMEKLKIMQKLS